MINIRFSIREKLILMIISSIIITLLIAISTISYFNIKNIKTRAIENITVLGDVIAERSTAALAFMDTLQAEKNLNALKHMKHIELACLYTNDFVIVADYKRPADKDIEQLKCLDKVENNLFKGVYKEHQLHWGAEIILDNSKIGFIYIVANDSFVFEEFYEGMEQYIIILIVVIILSYFIANRIQNFISKPILQLKNTAGKVAIKKDFTIRAEKSSDDEIGDLTDTFNAMLEQTEKYENTLIDQKEQLQLNQETLELKVKQRTNKLQILNDEITETLNQVESMQAQLIESEKMASLGGLVAGIAHEVNTPIGICLTASSFLKERYEQLQKAYKKDVMTQDDFEDFLTIVQDSSDMILKNIQRATEIVQNFKKVAVDQSVEDKRCFNIKDYFFEIIKSLNPKLKQHHHVIEVNSDDNLFINSYPGAFYQVFSNLIINSIVHGFESIDAGHISINVVCDESNMSIEYHDNGQGMSPEILNSVFEPFVTTKRNKGGTGLGAHIIYNIITQQLHGTISCCSEFGEGVMFKMTIPVVLCEGEN
ncbi:MAG: ATP-binding protein [Gammaproteobacteria bacterium]|nr:ATP-binding protein [Gammaproteobacteria bacterium]